MEKMGIFSRNQLLVGFLPSRSIFFEKNVMISKNVSFILNHFDPIIMKSLKSSLNGEY